MDDACARQYFSYLPTSPPLENFEASLN